MIMIQLGVSRYRYFEILQVVHRIYRSFDSPTHIRDPRRAPPSQTRTEPIMYTVPRPSTEQAPPPVAALSTAVFQPGLFKGKVLFCTGGGSGICKVITQNMVCYTPVTILCHQCIRDCSTFVILAPPTLCVTTYTSRTNA